MELTDKEKNMICGISNGTLSTTLKNNSKAVTHGAILGLFAGFVLGAFVPKFGKIKMALIGGAAGGLIGYCNSSK